MESIGKSDFFVFYMNDCGRLIKIKYYKLADEFSIKILFLGFYVWGHFSQD